MDPVNNVKPEQYFAYGSNMSEQQMKQRCPSAQRVGVGYITRHQLVFNRYGRRRSGGVASIAPSTDPESRVYGIRWHLSATDLDNLDAIESPIAYQRLTYNVMSADGNSHACQTYIAYPETEHVTPGIEYFNIIMDAAKHADFPAEYLEHISKFDPSL